MKQSQLFNILDSVDSTNNYAMAKVHEGLATHGMAWFAHVQTAGRGQRGKPWASEPGENIILSMVLKPKLIFRALPFQFSAFIALCCYEFIHKSTGQNFFIKWPNDIYWRDRKAGGILIENSIHGSEWKWAVVGIGINANQMNFNKQLPGAVSLREITGEVYDPVLLAQLLHEYILSKYDLLTEFGIKEVMPLYNDVLYKKNELVKLRKDSAVFSTTIRKVNNTGQLITEDAMVRNFDFGTIEWIR